MARRRFNTTRGFRRRGSETRWLDIDAVDNNLAAPSTAVLSNALSAGALALRPFTVLRSRIFWHVTTDQTVAPEQQSVSMGVAIVSDQAVAIGVTAVPTPDTDRGSDLWFVYDDIMTRFFLSTAVGFNMVGEGHIVDSKAMRKVEDGEDLIIVQETTPLSAGVNVYLVGRILIKLH